VNRRRLVLYLIAAPVGFLMTGLVFTIWNGFVPLRLVPAPVSLTDRPLPAFDLPGLGDGAAGLSSADLAGGITVLNLFASWCIPCEAEHPFITRLSGEQGLRVVGIAWMDDPAATAAWLAEHGNPYARIGVDRTAALQQALDVKGVPTTFIVDAAGSIRFAREGPLVGDKAIADFRAALDRVRR